MSCSRTGKPDRQIIITNPGSPPSIHLLSKSPVGQDFVSSQRAQLREHSVVITRSETRGGNVDFLPAGLERPQCPSSSSRSAHTNRCVQKRLGCLPRPGNSQRSLVSPRAGKSHQLPGTTMFYALKSLLVHQRNVHVRIQMDSSVAMAYINHKGGTHSRPLIHLAIKIWSWCLERDMTLSAEHLPGSLNIL